MRSRAALWHTASLPGRDSYRYDFKLGHMGGVDKLMCCTQSRALDSIASNNAETSSEIWEAGAIAPIVRMLKIGKSVEAQRSAAGLMASDYAPMLQLMSAIV